MMMVTSECKHSSGSNASPLWFWNSFSNSSMELKVTASRCNKVSPYLSKGNKNFTKSSVSFHFCLPCRWPTCGVFFFLMKETPSETEIVGTLKNSGWIFMELFFFVSKGIETTRVGRFCGGQHKCFWICVWMYKVIWYHRNTGSAIDGNVHAKGNTGSSVNQSCLTSSNMSSMLSSCPANGLNHWKSWLYPWSFSALWVWSYLADLKTHCSQKTASNGMNSTLAEFLVSCMYLKSCLTVLSGLHKCTPHHSPTSAHFLLQSFYVTVKGERNRTFLRCTCSYVRYACIWRFLLCYDAWTTESSDQSSIFLRADVSERWKRKTNLLLQLSSHLSWFCIHRHIPSAMLTADPQRCQSETGADFPTTNVP